VGAPRTGPHLIQLATEERAFCMPAECPWTAELLGQVLQSERIIKVGFGMASDRQPLHAKFGVKLRRGLDLAPIVRRLGYRQRVGLRAAVAIVLGRQLAKSKSIQTSNWAARPLKAAQLSYAANDAYAALCVFRAMQQSHAQLLEEALPSAGGRDRAIDCDA
jgi:ribonuclease D